MTDADKVMNPQHCGSDILIYIWINSEIRIQIPDYFQLRLNALMEVYTLLVQSNYKLLISMLCSLWSKSKTGPSLMSHKIVENTTEMTSIYGHCGCCISKLG